MLPRISTQSLLIIILGTLCLVTAQYKLPLKFDYISTSTPIETVPCIADRLYSNINPQFITYKLLWQLHHQGDIHGLRAELSSYDIKSIINTLNYIDNLGSQTELTALLAAGYYSHTQNVDHLYLLAEYLNNYALLYLPQRWPWLLRSIYITCHRLGDLKQSQRYAAALKHLTVKGVPTWVIQSPQWLSNETCNRH